MIFCALTLFQQVISRWEEYMSKVRPNQGKKVEVKAVADLFPFCKYFSNAPQPVFKGRSYEEDMDIAEGCYRHIKKIFTQLEVFIALMLLQLDSMWLTSIFTYDTCRSAQKSHHLQSYKPQEERNIFTDICFVIFCECCMCLCYMSSDLITDGCQTSISTSYCFLCVTPLRWI